MRDSHQGRIELPPLPASRFPVSRLPLPVAEDVRWRLENGDGDGGEEVKEANYGRIMGVLTHREGSQPLKHTHAEWGRRKKQALGM